MPSKADLHRVEIFGQFKHMFPSLYQAVTYYSSWGEDSIRIELTGGTILLFEYRTPRNWMLCTEDNELIRLEGESRIKQVSK